MSDSVIYIISTALLIALAGLAFWIARQTLGRTPLPMFQSRKIRRLGLVEAAYIDRRRRMLLIRRDNVEHLIITGGPVDVLVETGIKPQHAAFNGLGDALPRADSLDGASATFTNREEEPALLSHDQAS